MAYFDDQKSDDEMLDAINALQFQVADLIASGGFNEEDDAEYYVATDHLNIRNGPSTADAKIDLIHPNQKVRLIRNDGQWLYVESFDFVAEIPRTGWVYKRYLKRIDQDGE